MGITDLFVAEDRIELKVSQVISLIEESKRNEVVKEMLYNGVKNRVSYSDILKIIHGNSDDLIEL